MRTLSTPIGAIVMGVCFSTMTVAQAPVALPETPPGSILQAKSTGAGGGKKSGKKNRKKQKKQKRGNSNPKRSPPRDSSYKVFTT